MNLKLTLLILLIALFFLSISTGHTTASFSQGITALYYGDGPLGTVMRQIRLPRAILAMLVGASLGVCGAALQGYLRNPLAEPGLIGVSGSAALGAVISLQTGFATYVWMGLPIAAFSFATLDISATGVAKSGVKGPLTWGLSVSKSISMTWSKYCSGFWYTSGSAVRCSFTALAASATSSLSVARK